MNVRSAPIGIFDSGLGGLSVAREIRRLLPAERLLYAADSAFCPYGSRSADEIRWRSLLVCTALIERGIKLLVIACNTATAIALEELRAQHDIPIVGLEPAVKPAVALSRSGRIAVLATPRTAGSDRLARLIARFSDRAIVHTIPAPGLVDLVETGEIAGDGAERTVRALVTPLIEDGVDTIVLGCTHYPFLRDVIQSAAGPDVTLIDSGEAIARRTMDLVQSMEIARSIDLPGGVEVFTTGEIDSVSGLATRLLGEPVTARLLETVDGDYDAPPSEKLSAAWTISTSAGA